MSEGDFTGMDAGEYYAMRDFEALERSHNSEVDKDKKIRNQRIEIEHLKNKIREIKQSRDHFKRHYEQSNAKLAGLMPKWIPVTDRLPESGTRALVMRFDFVTKTPFYDLLWFDKGEWWNRHYTGDYAVTHWMPLPAPPKGENDGT